MNNELEQLIVDLWEVRSYGIKEMELWKRVVKAVPDELHGIRPIDENGISLIPEIKDGKISYTHYFE